VLGRFLPFHSTSVNPLLFHFATPGHLSIQFWYGAALPIPPRLTIATRSLTPDIRYPFLCCLRYLSPTLSRLVGPTIRTVREQAWGILPVADNHHCLDGPSFSEPPVALCSRVPGSCSGAKACRDKKQKAGISVPTDAQALDRPGLFLNFQHIFTSERPTVPRGNIV